MSLLEPSPRPCLVSVVIRTYNESKHLPRLLSCIAEQQLDDLEHEVVVIDSGSTDNTRAIAEEHGCRITHIRQEDFSFGRSLNMGCEFARGQILVFVSGHCMPDGPRWLYELVQPLLDGHAQYAYGRQIGAETTKFSEAQLFSKYFPAHSLIPQEGFFCNNANAAITRTAWQELQFDEQLTGLEDMALARRLVDAGGKVAYVATAPVLHIHDESWKQVRHRYEREAIAMQNIAPNLHVDLMDCVRFFTSAVLFDFATALTKRSVVSQAASILSFRFMQYQGTYNGNRQHRKLSQRMKMRYYYPTTAHHPELDVDGPQKRTSAI